MNSATFAVSTGKKGKQTNKTCAKFKNTKILQKCTSRRHEPSHSLSFYFLFYPHVILTNMQSAMKFPGNFRRTEGQQARAMYVAKNMALVGGKKMVEIVYPFSICSNNKA